MAVELTGTSKTFSGTGGSAVYAPEFYINSSDQVRVYVDDVIQTLGDDYVLGGVGAAAGCTVTATFPLGSVVLIERVTPVTQLVDTQNNETILEDVIDAGFDKLTMIAQEISALVNLRVLLIPRGESTLAFPARAARKLKYLGFDNNGDFALLTSSASVSLSGLKIAFLDDYILSSDPLISGYPDASAAFARAAAEATLIVGTAGKIYYVKDVALDSRQFDGQNCVLRDAPGARWGIKISGYGSALRRFTFQDQGNYVSSTTLSSAMLAAATTAVVASAAGIEIGDVIFIDIDANEIRHQTFVTNVVGNTLTIRDGIPSAAAAGKAVDAMTAAVRVGAADQWLIEDVLVVNSRGALLTMPETVGTISNRGSVCRFKADGSRYFGWIKAGDCAGVKCYDVKLWCGFVETFSYNGNGTAGPFSFAKRVFLLRDITVTVNGVPQVYGTDWNYASQTAIQFLPGKFPANGAAIFISHFRDGFRGFVEDQRSTAIISGGNCYDTIEVLDAFVGAGFFESELTEVRSLISDTCQYVALQTTACANTLVFTGDCFLGFSGASFKTFGSITKAFMSLYTRRVPLAEQWLGVLDDNIYVDSTSDLRVNAGGWTGEFQHNVVAGGKFTIVGGHVFHGRNVANIAGGLTVYLADYGHSANLGDTGFRMPRDGTFKEFRVDVDNAPGAGQSYTYDVLVSGVSIGQVVISGASTFAAVGNLNSFAAEGALVNLRLITSAGAAAGARHFMQVVMI